MLSHFNVFDETTRAAVSTAYGISKVELIFQDAVIQLYYLSSRSLSTRLCKHLAIPWGKPTFIQLLLACLFTGLSYMRLYCGCWERVARGCWNLPNVVRLSSSRSVSSFEITRNSAIVAVLVPDAARVSNGLDAFVCFDSGLLRMQWVCRTTEDSARCQQV